MTSHDTTIVDRHGLFEIHKVSVVNPSPSKRLKLGILVRSREWISKEIITSFPNCGSEYAYLHEIKAGSVSDEAGVLVNDILCSFSQKNGPIGFFHDLLIQGGNKNGSAREPSWKLMTYTDFELLIARAEKEQHFSFYVARKAAKSEGKPSESLKGVTLSSDITQRALFYNSLSVKQQATLLDDARANARLHFETERDAVLKALPDSVQKMFSQIGFVQWGRNARSRTFLPVLILSPYDVPPGKARETWLQKYQTVSRRIY